MTNVKIIEALLPAAMNLDYAEIGQEELIRLYEKAKRDQWNASVAIDWTRDVDLAQGILEDERIPIYGTPFWDKLNEEKRRQLNVDQSVWALSQFLHGEQAGLVACGEILAAIPTHEGKFYVASQVMDEARHVEVYRKYLVEKIGRVDSMNPTLHAIVQLALGDSRWYVKLIGIQLILESLALSAFRGIVQSAKDPLVRDVIRYVMSDESRHVAFGIMALKTVVAELGDEEREELAAMAFQACGIMAKGFFSRDIFERAGFSEQDIAAIPHAVKDSPIARSFRADIWKVLIPNLKRVGLITERMRPEYERVKTLQYENLPLVYEQEGG